MRLCIGAIPTSGYLKPSRGREMQRLIDAKDLKMIRSAIRLQHIN